MKVADSYEPDSTALTRPGDIDLDAKLTGKAAVDVLATAIRNAAYVFTNEELSAIATAECLHIDDEDAYTRGYDLLREMSTIEDRVTGHYNRFDKPLNFLNGIVRGLKKPQITSVTPVKQGLSKRLGAWKAKRDELDRVERQRRQAIEDAAARQAQEAKADTLDRVAQMEPNPLMAESLQREAATVRSIHISAAPVSEESSVPVVQDGYTTTTWTCEFLDVKALLRAYVDGKCFLNEDAIMKGLQSSMNDQASALQGNLSKAFPGTRAVPSYGAVARRRK